MIDKLEAGKTYRLIDKVGYFGNDSANSLHYEKEFKSNCITIEGVDERGEGYTHQNTNIIIIGEEEFRFFELVLEKEETPHLWDGKEELEVGMLVENPAARGQEYIVKLIKGAQVVIEGSGGFYIDYKHQLGTLIPDPKVVFAKKMLQKVRGSHIDFAHDNTWDITELASMCYEELMEGKDE